MALNNRDEETIRRYLLGKLTDDEEVIVEQRVLTENGFFEDMEVTKDELVEEYLAKQLTKKEAEWFEQHFLASPEGKQRQGFAIALNRYVVDHRLPSRQQTSLSQRFVAFWNSQPGLLRAAASVAVVVIVAGIVWTSRAPSPQTYATLTLTDFSATRSSASEVPRKKLTEDALRINLMLPAASAPDIRYRVELRNDKGQIKTLEVDRSDAQSLSVQIPAAQLTRGQYAITLSTISPDGNVQRTGNYQFIIE